MRIGNFIIFGKKPEAPQPVISETKKLGLATAETIFKQANGSIKGDESGAVPFAIVATAEALGAEVTIQEECALAVDELAIEVVAAQEDLEVESHFASKKILELEARIQMEKDAVAKTEEQTGEAVHYLNQRREEVADVSKFFAAK